MHVEDDNLRGGKSIYSELLERDPDPIYFDIGSFMRGTIFCFSLNVHV